MFDRNFEVMLSSLMIKIIGFFVNFFFFGMWVFFFFPLVCSPILGKRDEIYSSNNVTSFVHTCWICALQSSQILHDRLLLVTYGSMSPGIFIVPFIFSSQKNMIMHKPWWCFCLVAEIVVYNRGFWSFLKAYSSSFLNLQIITIN